MTPHADGPDNSSWFSTLPLPVQIVLAAIFSGLFLYQVSLFVRVLISVVRVEDDEFADEDPIVYEKHRILEGHERGGGFHG